MGRTKGLTDGYWYYRIYDVDTKELLAEGTEAYCCWKLKQPQNHYHYMAWARRNNPNQEPKWEIVEREWIPYVHLIKDTETGIEFMGDKASCREKMETILHKKMTDANFHNHWYGAIKRFERRTIDGKER